MSTANATVSVLFPVGRLVQGSCYKPQEKDQQGNPLVVKTGPNAGQATKKWFFAVAFPKAASDNGHWANTEWGKQIWAVGHGGFPGGQAQSPSFAWKVEDGDSAIPNKNGRKNSEREGFPGNWVVNFSSGFAPKIFNSDGSMPVLEPDAVKLGHYVQVLGTVAPNNNAQNPGVYVNHSLVAHSGYGQEIFTGPDPKAVGFGKAPAPVGMSATPIGGLSPAMATAASAAAPAPLPAVPAPSAVVAPPAAITPAPTAVAPHPGLLAPPPPAAAPAAPVGPQMTAKAGTFTYAQMIAAGWTDATLRTNGYLV